jgi:hypothetical protein
VFDTLLVLGEVELVLSSFALALPTLSEVSRIDTTASGRMVDFLIYNMMPFSHTESHHTFQIASMI